MNKKERSLARRCAGIVLCCLTLSAQAGEVVKVTPEQAGKLGVEVQPLTTQGGQGGISLPAQVIVPNGQLQVVSVPVPGLVETMLAGLNQPVKKGEPLARLQSPQLIEAQREFLTAATQSGLAAQSLKRDNALFQEGIIAEGRYLNTRGAAAQAGAAYNQWRQTLRLYGMSDAAIRKLQSSGQLTASLEVVSPLDGLVIEQNATPGQRTEASAPLYKVARLVPLWLDIQASLATAEGLRPGAAVTVPAFKASGKLLSVGRSVAPGSQTVPVRAEILQGAENLRAGQYVDAIIAMAGGDSRQWRVPVAAVARAGGKAYLFVQTKEGFRTQEVAVSGESGGSVTVRGALKGDERIAVRGVSALKASWMGLGGGE